MERVNAQLWLYSTFARARHFSVDLQIRFLVTPHQEQYLLSFTLIQGMLTGWYIEKYLKTAISLVSKTSEESLPFPPKKTLPLLWENHRKLHPQNATWDGLKGKQVLAWVECPLLNP